jgi:tripartite-type tricarboxylate transporter receptor subunit TctC
MNVKKASMITSRLSVIPFVFVLLVLPLCGAAFAEDFPTREIELVIGYAAGGQTDAMARIVGDKASKILKVPFVFVNKPGGGAAICVNYVANAKPDGYTIGTGGMSPMGTLLATSSQVPYQLKDLSGIARGTVYTLVLYTKKGRFESFADFVKEAQQKPGGITYASFGVKSTSHFFGELLNLVLNIKMKHVPFDGESKVVPAVLGGHIDVGIGTPVTTVSNLKAGTITVLTQSGKDRWPELPDVLTIAELGYKDATFEAFDGFITSSKVPADRLSIIQAAFEKALNDPEVKEGLKKTGQNPGYLSGRDYDALLLNNLNMLEKVASKAGIQKD